jgi:hypothetical protein
MRNDQVRGVITASSPADWELLSYDGLTFRHRAWEVFSHDQHRLEVNGHPYYMAGYKADVDLRLGWGLKVGEDLTYEGLDFPEPGITREIVSGFWRGALVAQWFVLAVDGHRCYLPEPERAHAGTGELIRDAGTIRWTAPASHVRLARLLQRLGHPSGPSQEFEHYLQRSGIAATPGLAAGR